MSLEHTIETDILVIGGGMAGCFAAIKAGEQGMSVTLVDKGYVGRSGATHFAEGDFTFLDPSQGHNKEDWIDQINRASEYINNRDWARIVVEDSYDRYRDLVSWGVKFVQEDGKNYVRRAGVHEHFAMVHREYAPILRKKALECGVTIMDRMVMGELIKQDGRIVGAVGFNTNNGDLYIIESKATVIAAGSSSLKLEAKPTHYWTSDGEAMAYRAGAEITGKEFKIGGRMPLRSGVDAGMKMAPQYRQPEGDWQERAIETLTRFPAFRAGLMGPATTTTINTEGGSVFSSAWEAHCGRAPVYIDLDSFTPEMIEWARSWFKRQGTVETDKIDLDLYNGGKLKFSAGRVEATQSIHGGAGIWPVDTKCSTALPGLYAAGNSCATLVSGASYAGMGIGLCHASVTGNRAGLAAVEYAMASERMKPEKAEVSRIKEMVCKPMDRKGGFSPRWLTQVLQGIVVPYFILQVKHEDRLRAAITLVDFLNSHLTPKLMAKDPHEWRMALEAKNMTLSTEMVLRASLARKESRGSHFREDYPRRDDPEWLAWVKLRDDEGRMKVFKEVIPEEWWPDLSLPYEERYPHMFPGE